MLAQQLSGSRLEAQTSCARPPQAEPNLVIGPQRPLGAGLLKDSVRITEQFVAEGLQQEIHLTRLQLKHINATITARRLQPAEN